LRRILTIGILPASTFDCNSRYEFGPFVTRSDSSRQQLKAGCNHCDPLNFFYFLRNRGRPDSCILAPAEDELAPNDGW